MMEREKGPVEVGKTNACEMKIVSSCAMKEMYGSVGKGSSNKDEWSQKLRAGAGCVAFSTMMDVIRPHVCD